MVFIMQHQFLRGSKEIRNGNNVVFFPENISSSGPLLEQKYALFFFNKHYGLYRDLTLQTARNITPKDQQFTSSNLNKRENYIARCIWGYLHDYFHHQGSRPLDEHLGVKLNRFSGLLEEIKVDVKSFLLCKNDKSIPYADEIAEYILLERLFRYPQEPDYKTNLDSGTGLFALSYFLKHHAIGVENNRFHFCEEFNDFAGLLVSEIEAIESTPNDIEYLTEAKEMVARYLPCSGKNAEFCVPDMITNSPIGCLLGKSKALQNLHYRGALDLSSQLWVASNIPDPQIHNALSLENLSKEKGFSYSRVMRDDACVALIFSASVNGCTEVISVPDKDVLKNAVYKAKDFGDGHKVLLEASENFL